MFKNENDKGDIEEGYFKFKNFSQSNNIIMEFTNLKVNEFFKKMKIQKNNYNEQIISYNGENYILRIKENNQINKNSNNQKDYNNFNIKYNNINNKQFNVNGINENLNSKKINFSGTKSVEKSSISKNTNNKTNENYIKKINELNNIDINNQINQLNNEIIYLKKELTDKNQLINQQQSTITNLQTELYKIKNNERKIAENLEKKELELVKIKRELMNSKNEINKLKENNINIENDKGRNVFAISFLSIDQQINYPIICNTNTIISRLEEEVYNEYPTYKDYHTYLTFNGNTLKRFKTIEENGIKKGDKILINIYGQQIKFNY